MADPAHEAAAGVASDLLAEVEDFTEPEAATDEATEAEAEVEQPQEDVEIPEITWELPEELRNELEAPGFDEDEDEEPVLQATESEDEYDDPEKAQLRKQLAKAQKKLAWENEQRIKASRKNWAEEARKYFQFSNPDTIEASSRRSFLKEAQRQHEAVAKVAKPVFDQLADLKAKAKEEALAEARAEAEERWGRPTTGPSANLGPQDDTQQMERRRLEQGRNFTGLVRDKIKRGEYKL